MVQLHQVNSILHQVVNDPIGADLVQNVLCASEYVSSVLFCSVTILGPRVGYIMSHSSTVVLISCCLHCLLQSQSGLCFDIIQP